MPLVKVHRKITPEPVGTMVAVYGYSAEVKEDAVYVNIPEDLFELEVATKRLDFVLVEEVKPEVVESPQEAINDTAEKVVTSGTGVRRGRPKGSSNAT